MKKSIGPTEELDAESMENAVPCLLTTTEETIERDSWLGSKRATYRVQKATLTVKDKVQKVEEFSNYLITPMKKRYDVVFRSTAVTFKAISCWLNLEVSDKAPKYWKRKRQAINERIISLTRFQRKEQPLKRLTLTIRLKQKLYT